MGVQTLQMRVQKFYAFLMKLEGLEWSIFICISISLQLVLNK